MSGYKNLPIGTVGNYIRPRFVRGGKHRKLGTQLYIRSVYLGMARMRYKKHMICHLHLMWEYPEKFFRQRLFIYSVVIVQPCKRPPANMYGTKGVALAPFHNVAKLGPVVDLLKLQLFNGSSRYKNSVKILFPYLVEGGIKIL